MRAMPTYLPIISLHRSCGIADGQQLMRSQEASRLPIAIKTSTFHSATQQDKASTHRNALQAMHMLVNLTCSLSMQILLLRSQTRKLKSICNFSISTVLRSRQSLASLRQQRAMLDSVSQSQV